MASPPGPSTNSAIRPKFLIRARSGTITETIGDVFTSLPSRFRRRRSGPPSTSSVSDPSRALSKLVSKLTIKDIKGANRIGSGGFGEVYLFEHPAKGKVALKRLCVSGGQEGEDLRRRALREGVTWGRLRHPNVLPFLGVLETDTDLYLVSPYAKNGSLSDYVTLNPNANRRKLLSEAAAAIAFLHERGIVHGDIKGANILVSDDLRALLCDFGLARFNDGMTSIDLQGVGTVRFQSPELLIEGGGKTYASDAWAFGMTIYEALSGCLPFHHLTTSAAVITAVVIRNERPPTLPSRSPSGMSYDTFWDAAIKCWLKDPAERPPMRFLLTLPRVLKGHDGAIGCLTFSPDGPSIRSGSYDRTVRIWDVKTGSQRGGPLEGHTGFVLSMAFSQDGTTAATGSYNRTLRLWDVDSGSQRGGRLEGHTGWVRCLAFSPDGTTIVSGSDDRSIRVWDVESGCQIGGPLEGHTGMVWCLVLSPNGTTIASGSVDHSVRLWDVESGTQRGRPLKGHTRKVNCLAFSPDGTIVASGSRDRTLRLWDVESGSQRGEPLESHSSIIWCLAFSPDGMTIASGSNDCSVCLWDVSSGSQIGGPLVGHSSAVRCLVFSPDSTIIASGSDDCSVRLWDAGSGNERGGPLVGHDRSVWCLVFSPDSSIIASGSDDFTIRLFYV